MVSVVGWGRDQIYPDTWLVGDWAFEKYEFVNWDDDIANIEK